MRRSELTQGYVRLQSSNGRFAGAVQFTDAQLLSSGTALNFIGEGRTITYFSQVAQNNLYFTGLAAINPNALPATASINVFDTNGQRLASATVQIPREGRFSRLLPELVGPLPPMMRGDFQVVSNEPLICFALFGTCSGSVLAATPPQYASGR